MKPSLVVDETGAIDLDNLPCTGCRHASLAGNVCKRYPPIFRPAQPAIGPNGQPGMMEGGWTFPPAIRKCGWAKAAE